MTGGPTGQASVRSLCCRRVREVSVCPESSRNEPAWWKQVEVFARSIFFSQTEICGQQEIEGSSTR